MKVIFIQNTKLKISFNLTNKNNNRKSKKEKFSRINGLIFQKYFLLGEIQQFYKDKLYY